MEHPSTQVDHNPPFPQHFVARRSEPRMIHPPSAYSVTVAWTLATLTFRTNCGPDSIVTASPSGPCRTMLLMTESEREPEIRMVCVERLMAF